MAVMLPQKHERPAGWLQGEVRRHCARCEAEVERLERSCPRCAAPLRKECPRCHYWVEMDVTFCTSCRHPFPLPPPPRGTVRLWHCRAEDQAV